MAPADKILRNLISDNSDRSAVESREMLAASFAPTGGAFFGDLSYDQASGNLSVDYSSSSLSNSQLKEIRKIDSLKFDGSNAIRFSGSQATRNNGGNGTSLQM